jgi:hypothetical protein
MTILDFCKNPSDEVDKTKKIVSLNRTQRRILYRKLTLRNVRPNPQGGWLVKTIMSNDEFEIFRKKGQGLYAWVTETQFNLMKDSILDLDWIKFGQYGSLNNNKTPDETITSEYRINEAIVILWAYRFTDDDIKNITKKYKNTDKWKNGPAYVVEQIVNKKITNKLPKSDGSGKETFWTSLPIIVSEVEKELNKKQLLIPFISSEDKEDAINKMINNPTKYFGLFATMRHGKSWDYLEYIKRKYVVSNILENHAIFCHDTKTYGGWKKKVEKSYKDCIDLIELKDNKDYDFSKTPKRNTIVLISPQLISASSNNEDITNFEEKLKSLKESYDIQVENIFVDEAHNYFTPQWERYYESILKGGQIILASGTAANLILKHQDKFDETNTFIWGIKELKNKLLDELNIDLKLEVKLIQLKNTDGSDFNIANLQSEDDGVLSNQYHFEEFVNKMINPNSKFSPIFSRERKHHIALFDTVNSAKEFKRLVQSSKYSDKIVPILVAGSKGRDANSEQEVNKLILEAESQGKRTITLTCGSMIQGVSERNWKSILNLSSYKSTEIYFQLFGRGFEFDNDLDNYIGQETKEERVIMWDYNPSRIYSVGAEFVDSMAKANGNDQTKALKYFFEIIDITEYVEEGRTWSDSKSYEEIESKINEIVNKNTIRRGLTVNTCLDKRFGIDQLDSDWIEWAIRQKWSSNGKNGDKVRKQKLDLWKQNLLKQKTDHSKSQKDKTKRELQKEVLDIREQVKRSFEQTLSKLDIVWAVYKSQDKVDYHIDELFKYSDEDEFLTGLGLPNKKVSKVFVETVKRFGLTDKINGKLKDSRIETIENFLNMDRKTLINTSNNGLDKWFGNGYAGDDTQLSVENWLLILEPFIKKLKLNELKTFHFPFAKSGSGILALTYLLKENSKKIFGRKLTNQEIIESVSYEDKNIFFESLISTMGFSKTTHTKKDFIIINPPYKRGFHIKVFNKAFEELNDGGTLICLHPSTQIINNDGSNESEIFRNTLQNYDTTITFINGNKIFDAGFFTPLSVTRVKKLKSNNIKLLNKFFDDSNNKLENYSNIDDIYIHPNKIVLDIRNSILKKLNKSIGDFLFRNGSNGKYYLKFVTVSGHPPKNNENNIHPDFYQLIYKSDENNFDKLVTKNAIGKKDNGGIYNELSFNSYESAKNGFEFLKTKFTRFCLSLVKTGQNLNTSDMRYIPYMDFSQEWTDEKLFDYFELTQEERDFINIYIPNWYERDFN